MDIKQLIAKVAQENPSESAQLKAVLSQGDEAFLNYALPKLAQAIDTPELLRNMLVQMGVSKDSLNAEYTNQLFNYIKQPRG